MATPVSISKRPSARRSVYDGLSSSMQASVVSHSPQAKKELFSSFPPPNRKALKLPGWRNPAAETIGSTLVRTTMGDQSSTSRRSRSESSSLRAGNGHSMISRISNLPLSHTVKVDSDSIVDRDSFQDFLRAAVFNIKAVARE